VRPRQVRVALEGFEYARWTYLRSRSHVNLVVDALDERLIAPLRAALEANAHETVGLFFAWHGEALSRGTAEQAKPA
jgi:hypothetical protein